MEKVEKLTQEQYNRLKFEGEVKKDILKRIKILLISM